MTENKEVEKKVDKAVAKEVETPKIEKDELIPLIQAVIFAHGEPIPFAKIKSACPADEKEIKKAIKELEERFKSPESGIELKSVAGKYQFRTKKIWAEHLKALKESKPRRLSGPALETLAVIAYRQPVVKSDIEKIRGVDPTPTLKTLIDRRLIKIVGHQDTVGQPALYGTTENFLKIFGLDTLSALPSLRDLKELEEDPGETDEENLAADEVAVPIEEAAQLEEQIESMQTEEVQEVVQNA